jgi:hypothetical protein
MLINLSGDYVLPESPESIGTVSGDLRLAELDAFLHTLNSQLSSTDTTLLDSKLEEFLIQVATTITSRVKKASVELEIRSKLIPVTNELIYTFKFNVQSGKVNRTIGA